MLADRLLAPLLALEPERRDTLLGVLRAWLGGNGSWDATAKSTGLHRNSVRRQIGVIAELLGLDLNQAQARAELWIALQYIAPHDQAAPDLSTAGFSDAAAGAAPEFAAPAGQIPQER
jgi:purine catabolism regulator